MTAEFIYPQRGNFSLENNNNSINIYDTLYVQYQSVFPSLNLTLFCLAGPTNSEYYYTNAPTNPLPATGLYEFGTVVEDFGNVLSLYPAACHFKLTDYGDNDDALNGEIFYVTSNSASSTTFQPTATTSLSSSSASTSSSMTSATAASATAASATAASATAASATTSPASTTSATNAPTPTDSSHSSGLSTGAKAGIGVGVTLGVLALLIALVFCLRRKRRGSRTASGRRPELSASSTAHRSGTNYHTNRRSFGQQEMDVSNGRHEIYVTPQPELYTIPRHTAPHELLS